VGLLAGSAGADQVFDNDSGDGLWSNSTNWNGDAIPDDERAIVNGELTATVNTVITQKPTELRMGENGSAGTLMITDGGDLQFTKSVNVGRNDAGEDGTLFVSGGSLSTTSQLRISQVGVSGGLTGQVFHSGGSIDAGTIDFHPFNNEGVNTSLYEISGAAVLTAGSVEVYGAEDNNEDGTDDGASVTHTFRVTGNDATIDVASLAFTQDEPAIGQTTATYEFIFAADGITTYNATGDIDISAPDAAVWETTINVDLSALDITSDQRFILFQADSGAAAAGVLTGTFENETVNGIGGNITGGTIGYDATSVYIDVTAVPEPATMGLLGLGGLLALRRRRR
jgi:hypothetical protein